MIWPKRAESVNIEVFVNAPYDKLRHGPDPFLAGKRHRRVLGAEGVSVRTESVVSMLIGGVAFETPEAADNPKPAADKRPYSRFSASRAEALANPETVITRYVLYFTESLKGVSPGAPVTFLGLPIGEVMDVGFEYNERKANVRPRIEIAVYPRRFLRMSQRRAVWKQQRKSPGRCRRHAKTFIQKAGQPGAAGPAAQRQSRDRTALRRP